MLKKLMLAGVAVAMTVFNAPIAHAAVIRSGCGFNAGSQETVTGPGTFTGVAYGYAVFDDQGSHTLRCYVTVDGAEQNSTGTSVGRTFVATEGTVSYHADEGASVDLCTEIDGVTVFCGGADESQIPPQEAIDLLDTVFATIDSTLLQIEEQLDPLICPVLAIVRGIPGVIDINDEGDTTVIGLGPVYDCPPYGNLFPPA
jgi:hypothetical protein